METTNKKSYYSPSQKAATARYNAKAYDEIKLRVKKGMKPLIQELAAQMGMTSVNSLICYAIDRIAEEQHFDLTIVDSEPKE